jgi:hypothetical protein
MVQALAKEIDGIRGALERLAERLERLERSGLRREHRTELNEPSVYPSPELEALFEKHRLINKAWDEKKGRTAPHSEVLPHSDGRNF